MTEALWTRVDDYISDLMVGDDPVVEYADLPQIQVSPPQGKMLHLFARMVGAKRILEIGTLAGYSAIWLARALPEDGQLITLEIDPKHAAVAKSNVDLAGLAKRVEIKVGPALDTLAMLTGPFDLAFIDADKANIPSYFEWALKLLRPGGVIVVDNVVRDGEIIDPNGDEAVQGVRRFNEMIAANPRVSTTTIQTVGSKGYDGFALIVV